MSRISRILFTSAIACTASVQDAVAFAPAATPSMPSSPSVSRAPSSLDIDDDDIRRNDFEAFVTGRLQEELAFTNAAAKSTVEKIKLKSLDFVKAMDKTILKLGQSAQDQGWEGHVKSGFQPVPKGGNDIWPYVDMLIQFKLLISNMERMSNRDPVSNGCKCAGCPGLGSCKDGKNKNRTP